MVRIVTDSASDLPPQVAQELGITIVPIYLHFGTETYRDRIDISTEEFYLRLASSKTLPTTSAPSPGDFIEIFDKLAEETDEVLAIVVGFGATHDSALKGAEQRKRKECRVEIIDSRTAVMALGFLAIAAAEEAKTGANLDQIGDMVKRSIPKAHACVVLDTLEYLRRGGRIGRAQFFLGTLLSYKPIIAPTDGRVEGVARVRSRTKALEYLLNFARGFTNIRGLAVEYTTTPDQAALLVEGLDSTFPKERIYVSHMGPVIGTHTGPGTVGVAILEQ
jgi:DegV family protein with EDD domain